MIENPLVSIIIPVYNGSNYLSEAIDSALNQTYSNIEIIVVNDGSNDDGLTEAVALSYQNKIKYISKPNGGVSSALNVGISEMTGKYFSWLSHDDKYTPTKIESQVNILRNYNDKKVIALCGSQFIDKDSQVIAHRSKERFDSEFIEWSRALNDLFANGTYNGCAFLISKEYFQKCGLFDEQLRFSQDTLMWARLLISECSIVYDRSIGVQSRIHESQQTHKSRHLLEHDSKKIAEYIVPMLMEKKQRRAIYLYAKRNAKLSNRGAVKVCLDGGNLTVLEKVKLTLFSAYGKIRPTIRKIYYSVFLRMKTK